jgi:hypothetical protein
MRPEPFAYVCVGVVATRSIDFGSQSDGNVTVGGKASRREDLFTKTAGQILCLGQKEER